MAVVFTSNIGLAKPSESEIAKNWAANTELNNDNLTIITNKMNIPLTSYTPSLVASTSNPNIGTTGTRVGQYQDLEGFIVGCFIITFNGSGISAGSGDYGVTLPAVADGTFHFAAASLSAAAGATTVLGEGYFNDSSAVATSGAVALELVTNSGVSYVRMLTQTYSGKGSRAVNSAAPAVPAAGDSILGNFYYKRV